MAKILIVDDDPDVVEACRLVLDSVGHAVATAGSRTEGMQAVAAEAPDLIVLDVIMEQPDDGIAMAQELRRLGFTKPILMLTSIGKVTGLPYGSDPSMVPVDAFVEKPIDPAALIAMIADLLDRKEG
jgi:DNA-binding response OmpR family regulator